MPTTVAKSSAKNVSSRVTGNRSMMMSVTGLPERLVEVAESRPFRRRRTPTEVDAELDRDRLGSRPIALVEVAQSLGAFAFSPWAATQGSPGMTRARDEHEQDHAEQDQDPRGAAER